MTDKFDIHAFWNDVMNQNKETLPSYFWEDAVIRWHCTNEQFNVSEYIRANCEYPGCWEGELERIEEAGNLIIAAGHVLPMDHSASFHVVSFLKIRDGKIQEMDEYWADDEEAPQWRRNMKIGIPIR